MNTTTETTAGPTSAALKRSVDRATAIAAKNPEAIPAAALASVQEHTGVNPAMALTREAFRASVKGFAAVWAHEMENKFGRSVVLWSRDIFVAIVLPSLSLLWLAITTVYRFARKPETWEYVSDKYIYSADWLSSKFSSEPEKESDPLLLDVEG